MTYRDFFSHVVDVVEAAGATILIVGGIGAFAYFVRDVAGHRSQNPYGDLRKNLGRVIVLGLEVLIIADTIRTVVVDQTLESVAVLGIIVLIRVILSFSLEVEIDGTWPWNRWRVAGDTPTHGRVLRTDEVSSPRWPRRWFSRGSDRGRGARTRERARRSRDGSPCGRQPARRRVRLHGGDGGGCAVNVLDLHGSAGHRRDGDPRRRCVGCAPRQRSRPRAVHAVDADGCRDACRGVAAAGHSTALRVERGHGGIHQRRRRQHRSRAARESDRLQLASTRHG